MKVRKKSAEIFHKAQKSIVGGVNSPVRSFFHLGMDPIIIEKGLQDTIFDVDGHSYIDFCNSWGALILGHAHPEVVEVCQRQMMEGSSFGTATAIEQKYASALVETLPWIEKLRFVSSGTEATMTAARLARGYTKRDGILKFIGNYHGHNDSFMVQAGSGLSTLNPTSSSKGIPQDFIKNTLCLHFNDIEKTRALFHDPIYASQIAAVIIEPIAGNMGVVPSEREFMQMLREETQRIGALLIIDEVITGFRVGLRGAQEYYGIQGDISCYAKIIGGGFPVAALGGRAEIMDHLAPLGEVYQAGTLSGNPVAMHAGLKTLEIISRENFYTELKDKAYLLTKPIEKALENKNGCLQQVGSMFSIFFGVKKVRSQQDLDGLDVERFTDFFKYLFERGIYFSPSAYESNFIASAHDEEHLIYTRDIILEYIEKIT